MVESLLLKLLDARSFRSVSNNRRITTGRAVFTRAGVVVDREVSVQLRHGYARMPAMDRCYSDVNRKSPSPPPGSAATTWRALDLISRAEHPDRRARHLIARCIARCANF